MDYKKRYRRWRLLIAELNKERKKQAKKTDILCNDLVAANRDFIKKLDIIRFSANFYEAILGTTDLSSLTFITSNFIKDEIPDANVSFFLRQKDKFKLHVFESDQPILPAKEGLENCFTPEVVESICKTNKICTLDDMFAMGLGGNLTHLNKISAVTIPLSQAGLSVGFILIYRSVQNKLTPEELNKVTAIAGGLFRAIASCQNLCCSAD